MIKIYNKETKTDHGVILNTQHILAHPAFTWPKPTNGNNWRCSGDFFANFEQISHILLLFPLLILSNLKLAGKKLLG